MSTTSVTLTRKGNIDRKVKLCFTLNISHWSWLSIPTFLNACFVASRAAKQNLSNASSKFNFKVAFFAQTKKVTSSWALFSACLYFIRPRCLSGYVHFEGQAGFVLEMETPKRRAAFASKQFLVAFLTGSRFRFFVSQSSLLVAFCWSYLKEDKIFKKKKICQRCVTKDIILWSVKISGVEASMKGGNRKIAKTFGKKNKAFETKQ